MQKLSSGQKRFLVDATKQYHRSLPGSVAEEYLANRGLAPAAARYQLGFVAEPAPGHEQYRGMLSIPYIRFPQAEAVTVVSLRFRRLEHREGGKYNTVVGDSPRLYNTAALQGDWDSVGLAEGELDAITATLCGIPTVGLPGATSWKPHFGEPFHGFETVYIFADGDSAGVKFATETAKKLPNAKIVTFDQGEDVNSTYVKHGPQAITERLK